MEVKKEKMNVYELCLCEECGKVIDAEDRVLVHGAKNRRIAKEALESGKTLDEVKKMFCGYCYGKLPCGCLNSYPQSE